MGYGGKPRSEDNRLFMDEMDVLRRLERLVRWVECDGRGWSGATRDVRGTARFSHVFKWQFLHLVYFRV